jgi:hypothetical protein
MVLHSRPRLGGVIVGLWLAADRGAGALGFGSVCVSGVRTGMVARPGERRGRMYLVGPESVNVHGVDAHRRLQACTPP